MEVVASITESVLVKLASYAAQEISSAWGVQQQLRKLHETLSAIQLVLQDAERKQMQNPLITRWLGNLKDVCNDIQDVLDEMEFQKLLLNEPRRFKGKVHEFFSRWNPVVFNRKMGHKIKGIRERLVEIDDEKTKFSLVQIAVSSENSQVPHMMHNNIRETDSFPELYVVGRDEDKKQIITHLLNDSTYSGNGNVSVISIVGLGGLGKTTLAKTVYNEKDVADEFPLRMWICVSEDFDNKRLVSEVTTAATKKKCEEVSLDLMKTGLREILRGKKFLLVLDDVWDTTASGVTARKWNDFKVLFDVGAAGSKIVVTTRNESVASLVRPIHLHSLKGLSDKDSRTLFMKNAFDQGEEQRYQHLIEIGEDIVKKCGGVPLALATLGSLLYSKRERHHWLQVRDDEIWSMTDNDNIIAALKLSYNALPPQLKPCFAFCSLYPKDYLFSSREIVSIWMAQGFLKSSRENEDFVDIGLDYVRQFCSKSLFQPELDWKTGMTFKIHDLVHDLAIAVAGVECSSVNSRPSSSDFAKVRHMSISAKDLSEKEARVPEFIFQLEKLRTILNIDAEGGFSNQQFLRRCISRFKFLRALDIRNSTLEVLPSSIGDLIHLRYLNLGGNTKLKQLPASICQLLNLQFLDLGYCTALEELAKGIGTLINLRYLGITTQQMFLTGVFRRLTLLRTLVVANCGNVKSLGDEIEYLTNLRHLWIGRCGNLESLPPNMKNLASLHTFSIFDCEKLELMRSGEGINGLISFNIVGSDLNALPNWLQQSAHTLQSMIIAECDNLAALPEWFQNLKFLEQLVIWRCPNLSALPQGMQCLTALREFEIMNCPKLRERCKRETGEDWSKIKHVPKIELDSSDE